VTNVVEFKYEDHFKYSARQIVSKNLKTRVISNAHSSYYT